jgi:hypothetical protein
MEAALRLEELTTGHFAQSQTPKTNTSSAHTTAPVSEVLQ